MPPTGLAWPLGIFFGWVLLATLLAQPTARDLKDALGKWSFVLLLLPAYAQAVSGARLKNMLWILLAAVVLMTPSFIWSAFATEYGRARAFSGGSPNLGSNLMMASILFIAWGLHVRGWPQIRFLAAAAVVLACLGLSMNRSALLGCVAALSLIAGRKYPAWLAIGLMALGVVLAAAPQSTPVRRLRTILVYQESPSARERPRMWNSGMRMLRDRPLLGFASRRNFMHWYESTYRDPNAEETDTPGHVHNSVLQTAILHGVPGLGLLLWWLLIIWRQAWRLFGRATGPLAPLALSAAPLLIAVAVNAQFDFVIADGQRAMMFYTLTGLILGACSAKFSATA